MVLSPLTEINHKVHDFKAYVILHVVINAAQVPCEFY